MSSTSNNSGASKNYISGRIARLIEGNRKVMMHDREFETVDRSVSCISEKIFYDLNILGYTSSMAAFAFDTKFNFILGISWLKKHKPVADCFDDTLTLSCCGTGKVLISPSASSYVASAPTQGS